MITLLERWYSEGCWSGNCGSDSASFCEYLAWDNIFMVGITGHTCCATSDFLIDVSNGCAWEYTNLYKTVIHALLGKTPQFTTSYYNEEGYNLFWDYEYKKQHLWDGISEWDIPIDISIRKVVKARETRRIGKFSDFMRRS